VDVSDDIIEGKGERYHGHTAESDSAGAALKGALHMSKQEFLQNLRTARNVFFHRVGPRTAHEDPRDPNTQLARGFIWLAPSSVSGFDPSDFEELSPGVRNQLKERVQQFLDVTKRVGPDKQPSPDDVRRAMQAFLDVVSILEPYLSGNEELHAVRDVLESVDFPPGVVAWEFRVGEDSTGDPAAWIWLFVDQDVVERKEVSRVTTAARQKIHDAFTAAGIHRWPYVRARTAAEQRALGRV
jgi:hypothetical protein